MICVRPSSSRLAAFTLAAVAVFAASGAFDVAAAKSKKDPYALPRPVAGQAMLALISLDDQRITLYDADGKLLQASVSSGETGRETPVGIYSVLQKNEEHYSNLYNNAAMPHMQRITWSGVAMHGGPLPGYPASHGCVRLPYKFAEKIFGLTKLGTRVIISRNDVSPVAISHPLLFKRTPYHATTGIVSKAAALVGDTFGAVAPRPDNEPADVTTHRASLQAIIAAKTAEADEIEKEAEPARALVKKREPEMKRAQKSLKGLEKAEKREVGRVAYWQKILARAKSDKSKARAEKRKAEVEAKLAEVRAKLETARAKVQPQVDAYQQAADALAALEDERDAARNEASVAKRKLAPVAVFISLKTQKLYVRQGFQKVFETPVTIRDPYTPIGTHTFTATDYGDNGRDMRWNVVSIAGGQGRTYGNDDFYYGDYDDYYQPRRRKKRTKKSKGPTPTDLGKATAALDRITIPDEAIERISELVLPGSSLIVSDEAAHKETGKQTGFIVLISGEPQGAIKKRRRRDPYGDDYYFGYDDRYDNRRDRRRYRRNSGPFGWW
jgi:L,D-transpeptidase catalytic domain